MSKYNKIISFLVLIAIGYYFVKVYNENIEAAKPLIYVDNFSGSKVKINYKNQLWLELDNESSFEKKDLKQGTHIFHLHKLDNNLIDTIRINVLKENNYVLNLFGGMTYYEGEVLYLIKPEDGINHHRKEEREINKSFFRTSAEFIFERPPYRIEERSLLKMPTTKRKYLRRKNQIW